MNLENINSDLANTPEEIHGTPRVIGGITFMLLGLDQSNRAFLTTAAKMRADKKKMSDAITENLAEILSDVVVAGWSDMTADGEDVPYTKETALEIFTMHPKLATAVFNDASAMGKAAADDISEDAEVLGES